jgi:hypothetical protein
MLPALFLITSSALLKNGIQKAEAVYYFAEIPQKYRIETFEDLRCFHDLLTIESEEITELVK